VLPKFVARGLNSGTTVMLISFAPHSRFVPFPEAPDSAVPSYYGLAAMPAIDDRHFHYEPFRPEQPEGLETIEVIRPAEACYRPRNEHAPALVLIPGLGMDCRGYIRQFPLGALAEIHCPQAANREIPGEADLGHFARHVEEYILARELDKRPGGFVLGGSSMGGAVSLAICARGRVCPRALILLGSFAHRRHLPAYQRALAPLSYYLPIDWAKRTINPFLSRFSRLGDMSGGEAMWLTNGRVRRTPSYYGRAIMALTKQDQLDNARRIGIPTLVLHGTNDWVLPFAAGAEMAQTIPGARLVSIHGGGHGFFFTHPEPTNAAIASFLREVCNLPTTAPVPMP
jgi:non-heme chloroperoxidase